MALEAACDVLVTLEFAHNAVNPMADQLPRCAEALSEAAASLRTMIRDLSLTISAPGTGLGLGVVTGRQSRRPALGGAGVRRGPAGPRR
jgi:hypothetical protein